MKVKAAVALLAALLLPVACADSTAAEAARQEKVVEILKDGLFVETFATEELFDGSRWFKSSHEKYSTQDVSLEEVTVEAGHMTPDRGLVLDTPARHYGLAVKLDEPLLVDGSEGKKEMVVQYEVKLQKGLTCGGAYVKLLRADSPDQDYSAFSDSTPFVLMFGPDKCGKSDKLHLIFQHKNPISLEYEEKHMMEAPGIKSDKDTHLYTAVIRDDNTFEVFVDQESVKSGKMLDNFLPSIIPEKEIDDPEDSKPEDWVDAKKIRDPSAVKPEDWDEDAPARIPDEEAVKPADWLDDEPEMIPDPAVKKPEDWDEEDDGEFIVPQIPNPKCAEVSGCGKWKQPTKKNPAYKGKWYAPYIRNPDYKGEWAPRKIPNPFYFEDEHPARMDPIGALAVEVWTMTEGITFDNFWLGNDLKKAQEFAELTWVPKHAAEMEAKEKAKKAKKGSDGEGFFQSVETLAADALVYAQANPFVAASIAAVAAVLVTLALVFLCCLSATSGEPAAMGKTDSGAEEEEEDAKAVASDDGDRKLRQRKKAPIVKDD